MPQLTLFQTSTAERAVNVASVPQRSPFRYPGGKTWLVPEIRRWLRSLPAKPSVLIEPFAGGGIASLTAVFERLVDSATMVELDEQVASVWHTIIDGDGKWLADKIVNFDMNPDSVRAVLSTVGSDLKEKAFQTLLRNRVNHGGILAPGSGQIKHGENGKGLLSRWYPRTLERRILSIQAISDRIDFIQGDGLEALRRTSSRSDAVYFIDPPYTAAGKKAGARLYAHNGLDHEELFRVTSALVGDFLMTYDNADGVHDLARKHGFDTHAVSMKNTHHANMTELLIGRDLSWVRR
jgi:DNA adenine methylase